MAWILAAEQTRISHGYASLVLRFCKSYMDLDFEPWVAPLLAMVPYPIGMPMWTLLWLLNGLCGDTTIGNTVYKTRYFAFQ